MTARTLRLLIPSLTLTTSCPLRTLFVSTSVKR
nr:MAG TPA: hypothetical protein [Bacteriophage sp.]